MVTTEAESMSQKQKRQLAIKAESKLMNARCRLMIEEPWFGTFASHFEWETNDSIPTIGVILKSLTEIKCIYNPSFINKLSRTSIMAAIQHELMHTILLHLNRVGSRNPQLWNYATDMVINGKYDEPSPRIPYLVNIEDEAAQIIDGEKVPMKLIWLPPNWDANLSAEDTYERLEQCKIIQRIYMPGAGGSGGSGSQGNSGQSASGQSNGGQNQEQDDQGDDQGDGQPGNGNYIEKVIHDGGGDESIVMPGVTLDDHGVWSESGMSDEQTRKLIKDMVEATTSQVGAGKVPGNVLSAIKKLKEPIRNWKHDLRHIIGRKFGGKRSTFSRQNRRRQTFGTKGKSSHASAPLTVAIDTSASVDDTRLEQFMSEIESMSQRFKITLMQFDHGYQHHERYHRGDWQSLKIHGRGGTSFIEAFKAMDELSLWGKLTIICTDGEAAWPDPRPDVLWVIFPHGSIERAPKPPFGDTIYIER